MRDIQLINPHTKNHKSTNLYLHQEILNTPHIGRKEISNEINKIRQFRNRISHNEPICFKQNTVDFTEAIQVHEAILNLLKWIDPEILKFINEIDTVLVEINTKDPTFAGS